MTQEQPTENKPHYVVITGTNIRSTLPGTDYTPKVYDSEQIAQAAIDAGNERLKHRGVTVITSTSPISVDEYDWKYSVYRCTPKERLDHEHRINTLCITRCHHCYWVVLLGVTGASGDIIGVVIGMGIFPIGVLGFEARGIEKSITQSREVK